ncbi:hypothetical protein DFH06DRAFT_1241984 [Mycena polygramma]|nr:hypothetical protein DFH06DRAFT_1241984 [Mycena polygramma]
MHCWPLELRRTPGPGRNRIRGPLACSRPRTLHHWSPNDERRTRILPLLSMVRLQCRSVCRFVSIGCLPDSVRPRMESRSQILSMGYAPSMWQLCWRRTPPQRLSLPSQLGMGSAPFKTVQFVIGMESSDVRIRRKQLHSIVTSSNWFCRLPAPHSICLRNYFQN